MSEQKTIIGVLSALNPYPIPRMSLEAIAEEVGLDPDAIATAQVRESKAFKGAMAGVYRYLSVAPNVTQGGVSYSFSSSERTFFSKRAAALMEDAGMTGGGIGSYGWQGEDF